ncbi:phenazine antibiotic biosynthesis protein [Nocardia panacis]|uniref:Phenazine antibiotic biosynthesis protein n=1 Tax=Nocardia panacis TaxID=2340916 RepID=A0A3A4KBR7_9NOCA|nr:phenazine antibiotic biosynthesis protein [Nocardia panacis]RJO70068.1 phenazine antibiotic biosynthesis protein [Nocardia panacis]
MSERRVSALDSAWDTPPDADDFVREAVAWHFDPATGSRYWVERAKKLDFDPRRDVRTVADLTKFPNIVDELRDVPLEDLVPVGYKKLGTITEPPVVGESGGTTGAPKRVFAYPDVFEQSWSWYHGRLREHGVADGANWLGVVPAGPHMVGKLTRDTAAYFGGIFFTIDLDPRWAKRCVARGNVEALKDYVDHLISQIEFILRSQHIGTLAITPPLLEALSRRDDLVELINQKVGTITWSGASMDSDTRQVLRTEIFPKANLVGIFGSTMIFCGIPERAGLPVGEPAVFDPPAPFSLFSVVDPETLEPVPYGERGQTISHHITRNLFLPNNLERDTAIRHPHGLGHQGDSISEVRPVQNFGDVKVIEGVY